jgi:formate dehydrogenase major subunit
MKYQYHKAPPVKEYSTEQGDATAARDFRVLAKDIPCQEACPAKTNVPLYIERIANREFAASYRINLEHNVFPGVLGRICTRPCQDRCRHQWTNTNGPVTICHLKRAAADRTPVTVEPPPAWFDKSGKRVAIVGGGPAGLTTARELTRLGHEVTIFEREKHLGGMMVDGIPRFRLPLEVVTREIDLIVNTGVVTHTGVAVDSAKMEELIAEYDAVCIAAGTMRVKALDLEGIDQSVMTSGLQFMHQYNNNEITSLSGDVVIIGGGFTAVDCSRSSARAARKLLGERGSVSIMYRRTEQYMAAHPEELEELERESISVRTLVTPVRGVMKNGALSSVTFRRNVLSTDTADGKPAIIAVDDSEFTVPCNHLIIAIGQRRDDSLLPPHVALSGGFGTTHSKVFVTGDFATGSDNVIKAVANGKSVSREIDTFLCGKERLEEYVAIETIANDGITGRLRDHDLQSPSAMPVVPVPHRAVDNCEVEAGFTDGDTDTNAMRCYFCHYKFEIHQDECIHCNWCIDAAPRECIKKLSRLYHDSDGVVDTVVESNLAHETTYIWIDSDQCIRCGKCLRVCPTGAITMKRAGLQTRCRK